MKFVLAIIYLLCIPGFAWLYQHFCPADFYATSAHYEQSWADKESSIQAILQPAIERSSKDWLEERTELSADDVRTLTSGSSEDKQSLHLMIVDAIQVSSVQFDGTYFRFNVSFFAKAAPGVGYPHSNDKGAI